MTLIELGEISSGSASDEPDITPPRAPSRPVAVLLVALLCAFTVGGSARPDPRGLPALWSIPFTGRQFSLSADTVYVLGGGRSAALTAYDARDGTVRWTRPDMQPEAWLNTELPGLVLIPESRLRRVTGDDGNSYLVPVIEQTIALDARTGAERWRTAGEAGVWSSGLVLLTEWAGRDEGASGFRVVRGATGEVVWKLTPKQRVRTWTTTGPDPARPEEFITATEDGLVEVRRFADGAVLSRARMPRAGTGTRMYGSGRMLFVIDEDAGKQTVTAYDPGTLRPRWAKSTTDFSTVFDCGARLCLGTATRTVEAIDPATGRVAWQSTDWDDARPLDGGRRLITVPHQGGFRGVIDGATGRRVAEFDTGTTYVDPVTGRVLTVGLSTAPPASSPVTQFTRTDEVIMRGQLGPVADAGCQLVADRLACKIQGGTLTVTDVG